MTHIEQMIQDLCPNGVEFKTLGEVLDYEQPTPYIVKNTDYDESYSMPVLTAGQSFILGYTNEKEGIYKASKEQPTIIFDDFTTSFHWVDFDFKVKSSAMKMLRPKNDANINFRFVFYAMQCIKFQATEHTRYWISKYSQFEIPLPPLEIQKKIVECLDKFSALAAELQAELQMRRKQYEYYRTQLLTPHSDCNSVTKPDDCNWEWKTLGEIAKYRRGSFPQPYGRSEWYDGEGAMPFVQVADVEEIGMCLKQETKQRISKLAMPKSVFVPKGTVIVTLQGSIGKVAVTQYDSYVDRTLGIFESYQTDINKKYFAYQLERVFSIKREKARGGTIKTITKEEFTDFSIPIPSLTEQERIVSILDKFEALTTSLSDGIPAEQAAQQKRYEYYRDLLLTFDRKAV